MKKVIVWDFAAAKGDTIREKVAELYHIIDKLEVDKIVGGAESLALVEIAGCKQPVKKETLYPLGELLLVGPEKVQLIIKNYIS